MTTTHALDAIAPYEKWQQDIADEQGIDYYIGGRSMETPSVQGYDPEVIPPDEDLHRDVANGHVVYTAEAHGDGGTISEVIYKIQSLNNSINSVQTRVDEVDERVKSAIGLKREIARMMLAALLLTFLGGTVVGSFLFIFNKQTDNNSSRELITLIWTSQVGLMGSALGFYFGSEGRSPRESDKGPKPESQRVAKPLALPVLLGRP